VCVCACVCVCVCVCVWLSVTNRSFASTRAPAARVANCSWAPRKGAVARAGERVHGDGGVRLAQARTTTPTTSQPAIERDTYVA
jgi:hypothetical protein